MVFAAFMAPGALLAAVSIHRLRWSLLAGGALVLCVPATGIASDELGATAGLSLWRWAAIVISGAGVYICIAALPVIVFRLVNQWR